MIRFSSGLKEAIKAIKAMKPGELTALVIEIEEDKLSEEKKRTSDIAIAQMLARSYCDSLMNCYCIPDVEQANELSQKIGVAFVTGHPVPEMEAPAIIYIFEGELPKSMDSVFDHLLRVDQAIATVKVNKIGESYHGDGVVVRDGQLPAWGAFVSSDTVKTFTLIEDRTGTRDLRGNVITVASEYFMEDGVFTVSNFKY